MSEPLIIAGISAFFLLCIIAVLYDVLKRLDKIIDRMQIFWEEYIKDRPRDRY